MNIRLSIIAAILTATATVGYSQQQLQVVNPLHTARTGMISIPIKAVNTSKSAIVYKDGKTVISQPVDDDANGMADHLLIQLTMRPFEKSRLRIRWTHAAWQHRDTLVDVRLSYKSKNGQPNPALTTAVRSRGFVQNISNPVYQLEGPGIENDKVAFRSFFDYRNGKDIYGKTAGKPVLRIIGLDGSWHKMQWWGKDILHIGNSMGAGTLAVSTPRGINCANDADSSIYRVCYQGALAAAYRLSFRGWDGGQNKVDGYEQISMRRGDYYYSDRILRPMADTDKLVIGLSNFNIRDVQVIRHKGRYTSLSTYGMQADGSDKPLGLAVMFDTSQYEASHTTQQGVIPENTTYVELQPRPALRTVYVFACWGETDARFLTAKGFRDYLSEVAEQLSNPILVKIIR